METKKDKEQKLFVEKLMLKITYWHKTISK